MGYETPRHVIVSILRLFHILAPLTRKPFIRAPYLMSNTRLWAMEQRNVILNGVWLAIRLFMYTRNFHSSHYFQFKRRDNSVDIPTRYGLDDPGIESWWGARFSAPVETCLGPTLPPMQRVPGVSQG